MFCVQSVFGALTVRSAGQCREAESHTERHRVGGGSQQGVRSSAQTLRHTHTHTHCNHIHAAFSITTADYNILITAQDSCYSNTAHEFMALSLGCHPSRGSDSLQMKSYVSWMSFLLFTRRRSWAKGLFHNFWLDPKCIWSKIIAQEEHEQFYTRFMSLCKK